MAQKTSEAWAKRVERWRSGLTAAQFAAREGINRHTLTYWKWKMRRAAQMPPRRELEPLGVVHAEDFVELVAPRTEVAEPAFEVVLAQGDRVRLGDGFAGDAL